MESCLGISTENNLIKYAKVSKNRDSFTVDAFGVKFFDNLETAMEQIIEETESKNTPININLTDEIYNRFEVFSGLKKKDVENVLSSEFELLCDEQSMNYKALVSKYILSETPLDREKTTAVYVSANRGDIAGKVEKFKQYKINSLIPIPVALYNLLENIKENTAIVNIEDNTTITIIVNGQIVSISVLEIGMKQILDKISKVENSYARAYEACKNTTIYTMDEVVPAETGGEYLQHIMPVLYEIVTQTKEIIDTRFMTVQRIVLTGTATVINNLELYFQEYFQSAKCELLNPVSLVKNIPNTNTREIMEVNSALAIARQGIGYGIQDADFKNTYSKGGFVDEIKNIMSMDLNKENIMALFKKTPGIRIKVKEKKLEKNTDKNTEKSEKKKKKVNFKLDMSFKGQLKKSERVMVRILVTTAAVFIIYIVVTVNLTDMISSKTSEVDKVIQNTNSILSSIRADTNKIKSKISQYTTGIQRLETLNNQVRQTYSHRKAIANMLNRIMAAIPEQVQITSIENIKENRVKILAQSVRYEQLGYFGASLKNQGILVDVAISSVEREGDTIKIVIEGSMP